MFKERMKALLKDDYEAFEKALALPPKYALYLNTRKDENRTIPEKFCLQPHPDVKNGYLFDKEKLPLGKHPYHEAGLYYIQEPAAMCVVPMAGLKPGMKVLDLCAAPGGKSVAIADIIGDHGLLIANDVSLSRANILSLNIERMGYRNTVVTNVNAQKLASHFPDYFDAVFVDAPCSGEGMFRKLSEAERDWSLEKVARCAKMQRELIQAGSAMLKEGGTLMYSTCTYEYEENEGQVEYAVEHLPLRTENSMVRLYPHNYIGEGQFIAKLIKTEGEGHDVLKLQSHLNRKERLIVQDFFREYLKIPLYDPIRSHDHHLSVMPKDCPDLEGLKVLRCGLELGEVRKERFIPSHALALYLKKSEVSNVYDYDAESVEIQKYLHGETLNGNHQNGYGLICVDGFSLGFFRETNGVLKNCYPKGLRK